MTTFSLPEGKLGPGTEKSRGFFLFPLRLWTGDIGRAAATLRLQRLLDR
jgi:hypothetical protein